MQICFFGVRGSIAAPQLPSQIKSKISAILERLTPDDIASPENREHFLAGLPPWLFGTVGGNSPCVAVRFDKSSEVIVFDAGSGIRELGIACSKESPKPQHYHIFFSHFHWDHIAGLPFFNPAYDPSVSVDFYSPKPNLETALHGQMASPYFPVHMESMGAKKAFRTLGEPLDINGCKITWKKMNHPGDSYSYKVEEHQKKFIYATDTELSADDFLKNDENIAYFQGADLIVIDSQYTLGEAIDKYNWGHSAFSLAVDFAANWGIKHMVLFHHDPTYDDHKLFNILQSARWYTERMNIKGIKISLAMEGMELAL
ncbi:MBL fold metallo-hydrolase [Leadbettera azotonutricia]|uniref:Metallo-beta-lactamase family protein n=1 Tax=Leadbettera azotonutricia (strain ATCC BAA-888 / DSM 13862 / ZAS-9) TaxID=545695 RepID=F5YC91_LEAAZ|nr:MBL fold metallo-hydrolase [Leadbettera azotonutricia]AEF81802.1 metallo-beta-lactamase family protein [Leadbettera azotonutricia ZAS-9]